MKKKSNFPRRQKQDGSTDTMCLACFKTFSPATADAASSHPVPDQDHICAFAFPERRANEITFEDGPKRRQSDMDWQTLIGREAMLPGD